MKRFVIIFVLIAISGVFTAQAQDTVGVSAAEIEAYPTPNVTPLYPKDGDLYDRIYRQVDNNLAFYDSPNGTLVNDFGTGYNYVTLAGVGTQGDWTQVAVDRWIPTSFLGENVTISRFAGVELPAEGLPYTMAWTLKHLYPSSEPGGQPLESNGLMYRYSRVNIYSTVVVDGYNWYQIGQNKWVHQFNVAKILPISRPEGTNTHKWVSVDLYEQVLIAYEGETPVFATLISSGLAEWATNEGLFNVYIRYARTTMSGAYNQPDFYYLEEVPWTMYFDGDIGLHGTYWHDGFGYRQSHGCVNMSITDAKWVYEWSSDVRDFSVEGSPDLAVYVYSSGQYD